jgi:hypothetical protein
VYLEGIIIVQPENRTAELENWRTALSTVEGEQRERRLAPVVSEEEMGSGGETAPGTADRAAAENILGGKADKYLPR